jgi:hypothetical protein
LPTFFVLKSAQNPLNIALSQNKDVPNPSIKSWRV